MANIQLDATATPEWAKAIPEEAWIPRLVPRKTDADSSVTLQCGLKPDDVKIDAEIDH